MNRTMTVVCCIALVLFVPVAAVVASGQQDEEVARRVEIMGPFGGPDEVAFQEILDSFVAETGLDVYYNADPEFNTQIMVRTRAGNPPDMAAVPQPGTVASLVDQDALIPLPQAIVENVIEKNYAPVWKDLGSFNGEVYGLYHRINTKSWVWYPKKEFEARGYTEPDTWDEMIALMDQMVADGIKPWSIGIESGGATGWLATDWMEDIMLRTAGPEKYDQWLTNELTFDSPEVMRAGEYMEEIWMNEDYVLGGPSYIRGTGIGDAIRPLFADPPEAMLHRQGNFILNDVPGWVAEDLDNEVGVFPFPEIDPEWGKPVFGGGDQFVMFNDTPEVRAVFEYLGSWEGARSWAQTGTALFPHQDQNLDDYPSQIMQTLAQAVIEAQVFRFDGSDMMPAEIGAGAFWEGMADFVSGVPMDTVLSEIQEAWDDLE